MTQQNYGTSYRHRPLLLAYYEVDWSRDGVKGERGSPSPLILYMYLYCVVCISN